MSAHPYRPDPAVPGICATCDLPKGNRRHEENVESRVTDLPEARANRVSIGFNATATSIAAGLAHHPASGTLRAMILDVIVEIDPGRGVTDEELFNAPSLKGQKINSVRPRRSDLASEGWLTQARDPNGNPIVRNDHAAWTLSSAGRVKWVRSVA